MRSLRAWKDGTLGLAILAHPLGPALAGRPAAATAATARSWPGPPGPGTGRHRPPLREHARRPAPRGRTRATAASRPCGRPARAT
eukprot:3336367-Lingulodinium_polyedra.AAC.1